MQGKSANKERRVLVIDDDRETAQTCAELLRSLGQEAMYVCDSTRAVKVAIGFRPAIALVDIAMPSMDGYAVARVFSTTPELKSVWLVALTGHGEPQDYVRSREAGFEAHVKKPADIALLESILKQFDATAAPSPE
jgi:CheY-like chemotaxis protein